MNTPDLSIVIPFHNEQDGLAVLFGALLPVLRRLERSFEIVCVNDGSFDDTLASLTAWRETIPELVIVDLSRNFGKEAAVVAGLDESRGRAAIPFDADLQDPPAVIPELVARWDAGAEVVLAIRRRRDSDTRFKRMTANGFYRLINSVSDIEIPANAGDFRLMDRCILEALGRLSERTRFNKGLFAWLGFRTATVHYDRPAREDGESKWKVRKLWSFALDGITSFSSFPLRVWSYMGIAIAFAAILYGGVLIFRVLVLDNVEVPGYASLMVVTLFSCGLILTSLGVIGEYLSRIFIEVKQRPLYVVRRTIRDETRP